MLKLDLITNYRFDNFVTNYELDRLLPKAENKKVFGLVRNELGRKIMTKFVGSGAKTCSYSKDDSS